jgi:hypothetical protein
MQLASVNSVKMAADLHSLVQQRSPGATYWLGGSDQQHEGSWLWQDGTAWTIATTGNWELGGPDNSGGAEHCLQVRESGKWSDALCNGTELVTTSYPLCASASE